LPRTLTVRFFLSFFFHQSLGFGLIVNACSQNRATEVERTLMATNTGKARRSGGSLLT
jgi:hypothetical protein